jgi:hypothetical protein
LRAILHKGGGLALACYVLSDVATFSNLGVRPGLVVGLDETTGYLVVRESEGNATVKTASGVAVDLSAATHTYDVYWSATGGTNNCGTLAISIDNGLYNYKFYSLLAGWAGGCLGLYMMNTAGSTNAVTITDLYLNQP